MRGKLKLDETSVAKIIEIAMSNNENKDELHLHTVKMWLVKLK